MSDTSIQTFIPKETGWIADDVDKRDKVKLLEVPASLPESVDLKGWCSPVETQGSIQSCTAHAAITLVEYYQIRASGKHLDASRLFLYKMARNLLGYQEDKGANARTTMKALAMFGVPPEKYWGYDTTKLYEEPPAFCYALASRYRVEEYSRLDGPGVSREMLLQQIKTNLASESPLMFNFVLYQSCFEEFKKTGRLPIPSDADRQSQTKPSGHTVAAVGYNDKVTIKHSDPNSIETTGAILIRNSWGTGWGDEGYGWIPYEYVLKPLSNDWWTIFKLDWLNTEQFEDRKFEGEQ